MRPHPRLYTPRREPSSSTATRLRELGNTRTQLSPLAKLAEEENSGGLNIAARGQEFISDVGDGFNNITAFVRAFIPPKLADDTMPEAVILNAVLDDAIDAPQRADWGQIWHLNKQYWNASFTRIWSSPEVKNGLPNIFVALNGALVLLVLRLLVPRLLAIESLADLDALAPELGLPSREELLDVVTYTQEMNYLTKLGLFLLVITVEKVTLIGEFIPVGVVLPAISPILFGGVLQGTVISAFCAALGSSANFVLAKSFFREKFLELSVFDQPAVGESKWFNALSKNIEKDGFKAALFLRLAPVLPIPIDAHWYVCGLTPLKLWTEFFPAYFLGALKATFLDAYLGSMLTSAALGQDEIDAASKGIVVAETLAIVAVSVLVSQFATQTINDLMREEGFEEESKEEEGKEEEVKVIEE